MDVFKEFNGLAGSVAPRKKLEHILSVSDRIGHTDISTRITKVLNSNPKAKDFKISISAPAIDALPEDQLPGVCCLPDYLENEDIGLSKGVSPDEIYDYITKLIIETIQISGHLPWQRTWDKEMTVWDGRQAVNYKSKKPYRGINYWFTNFTPKRNKNGKYELVPRDLSIPYFLTFNQIEEAKGSLKKGAKGVRVFYFTKLYTHTEILPNGKKLTIGTYDQKRFKAWLMKYKFQIAALKNKQTSVAAMASRYFPILKYYNIFHGADVKGIKWDKYQENKNVQLTKNKKIEVAENIINSMPKKPEILFKGNQPAYYPSFDHIRIPSIAVFNSEQEYYSTLFHELIHSTGHASRLGRFTQMDNSKTEYAFEELIAEMGAVFLCAESGILFSVIKNSASYLKGWDSRLVKEMKNDNRYFFRASSKSQAAADFILDRNSEGIPTYRKTNPPKKEVPKVKTTKKRTKTKEQKINENGQYALLGPAGSNVAMAVNNNKKQTVDKVVSHAPNIDGLRPINSLNVKSQLWKIPGATGKFLQDIERKPVESVAIVLSTPAGTGKTTSAYKWMNDFAQNDPTLFLSLEEHPQSNLFMDKRDKYIDSNAQRRINAVGSIPDLETMHKWIAAHDVIVIDSWQKLVKQVGKIDFDEDLRKRHNGKVFIVIFQQTTTGRAKGGSDKVFDGDIIVMGHKGDRFTDNYLYFEKNRYTRVDLDKIHYNIADHKTYDPTEDVGRNQNTKTAPTGESKSWLEVR